MGGGPGARDSARSEHEREQIEFVQIITPAFDSKLVPIAQISLEAKRTTGRTQGGVAQREDLTSAIVGQVYGPIKRDNV